MGCASSKLFPLVHENGESVAPPYELKQAGDKLTTEGGGIISQARRMFSSDNITNKMANEVMDSTPVQNVIGGATDVKESALNKLNDAGDTIGAFAHGAEEALGSLAHDVEEKVSGIVSDVKQTLEGAMDAVGDAIGDMLPGGGESPAEEEPEAEGEVEADAEAEEPPEGEVNQENGEVDEILTVETTEEEEAPQEQEEEEEQQQEGGEEEPSEIMTMTE